MDDYARALLGAKRMVRSVLETLDTPPTPDWLGGLLFQAACFYSPPCRYEWLQAMPMRERWIIESEGWEDTEDARLSARSAQGLLMDLYDAYERGDFCGTYPIERAALFSVSRRSIQFHHLEDLP